jgi:cardiolipin synthase A/B
MGELLLARPGIITVLVLLHMLGFLCACAAVLQSRTPQGATAWVMSLLFLPLLSVPLFLVFGRSKFEGYNTRRKKHDRMVLDRFETKRTINESVLATSEELRLINATISGHNQPGFTRKNKLKLLIDAQEAYPEMLAAIQQAEHYIVFQFYIFRPDQAGRMFVDLLMQKARTGVRVSFMHDEIGAHLPANWWEEMKQAGIKIGPFHRASGRRKLQINFRNHRKVLIVDGKVGFLGGLNIGDDYRGLWPKWGPWRDTHVRIEGPSVIAAQLASAKDWYCTQEGELDVDWEVHSSDGESDVFIMHTGPADDKHSCLLAHIALINCARERLWISSPYFVPPESLMDAILMAALRGVDVRLLVPSYSDSNTVLLASRVYHERLLNHNVRVFHYVGGFLHQKAMVVDESFSVISSANFDCRSMFINFEIMAISADVKFNRQVGEMLQADFARSRQICVSEFEREGLWDKITSRAAHLLSPIL